MGSFGGCNNKEEEMAITGGDEKAFTHDLRNIFPLSLGRTNRRLAWDRHDKKAGTYTH